MAYATYDEAVFNELMKHATYIELYKNTEIKQALKILDDKDKRIRELLIDEFDKATIRTLERLLKKIEDVQDLAYDELQSRISDSAETLASDEQENNLAILTGALPAELATAIVFQQTTKLILYTSGSQKTSNTLIAGKRLDEWVDSAKSAEYDRVISAIRQAKIDDVSTSELINRLYGTKSQRYLDGLNATTRNQVSGMLATVLQSASDEARKSVIAANSGFISKLRYVAVLDSKTSPICRSRSGRLYDVDKAPYLPAHVRCRSHYAYVIKSVSEMLGDSKLSRFIADRKALESASPAAKAYMSGSYAAPKTFSEWLKGQSVDVQNGVLGIKRAKLFRDGGLSDPLRAFYSEAQKKQLTLRDLRAKYPDAFRRAGLTKDD